MKTLLLRKLTFFSFIVTVLTMNSCKSDENENEIELTGNGGYIFCHMTNADYGSLYYSVSSDGITWTTLNGGKSINGYRGHSDICIGSDGKYYMIGITANSIPVLWTTTDFLTWQITETFSTSVFDVSSFGYSTDLVWYGAPKMFFDTASKQYIITWHASLANLVTNSDNYWRSMRTFYILTSDFKTFTKPKRLFTFTGDYENMATIDAIIRKIDGKYHIFVKDERWPGDVPNAAYKGCKAINHTKSDFLTGPYENPTVVTDTWTEAPTLIPKPNNSGWYLYVEQYPINYVMYKADDIDGIWMKTPIYMAPSRHGSMIWIDKEKYINLLKKYKK
jgi:hypothetical protein